MAELLTPTLAAAHQHAVVHYDADFETDATIGRISRRSGSIRNLGPRYPLPSTLMASNAFELRRDSAVKRCPPSDRQRILPTCAELQVSSSEVGNVYSTVPVDVSRAARGVSSWWCARVDVSRPGVVLRHPSLMGHNCKHCTRRRRYAVSAAGRRPYKLRSRGPRTTRVCGCQFATG
jgi:hypothetical protein